MTDVFMTCCQRFSQSAFDDTSTAVAFPGFQLCSIHYGHSYVTDVSLCVN